MRVIIVDDSAQMRHLLRGILDGTAEVACECSDGDEAVEAYAKYRPDWVLMDIKMKRVDGFQATREILSSFPDARIIMITQYDDARLKEKASLAGAQEFVLKENLVEIGSVLLR